MAQAGERVEAAKIEVQKCQGALLEGQQKLAAAEAKAMDDGGQRHALITRSHQLELQMTQAVTTATSLKEELHERFELKPGRPHGLETTLQVAEAEIRRLRGAIERADHVNLASIEEFEVTKERRDHLVAQIEDLEASKTELLEIIAELDKASREKFTATFEQVRENFKKQFAILFSGGEADLCYVGSDDVLEAGIDLIAKPPGKKMRSIKLLSGGEKCMTAMALLFAIFEVKPAPFCILDEMDAPLDDANVRRFIEVLRPFMDRTQFLIITHNKITMEIADILYGVSMEEKGVSKPLSIRFEKQPACV